MKDLIKNQILEIEKNIQKELDDLDLMQTCDEINSGDYPKLQEEIKKSKDTLENLYKQLDDRKKELDKII